MRLTLRTLLAYLDDTLEPAEIKDIGQKVAESDAAQELIGRIKEVTRRRRLTVPPATGPGAKFDANTVAEYLDNVLPADQVSEVEETCLKSDVHLAEVASCHQILTLVLGEPALVPPTARQRMYGIVRGRESRRRRAAAGSSVSDRPPARDPLLDSNPDADEAFLMGLPHVGRQNWLPWLIPAAALLLLAVLGFAVWQAFPSRPPRTVADGTDTGRSAAVVPVPQDKKDLEQPKDEKPADEGKKPAAGTADEQKPAGTPGDAEKPPVPPAPAAVTEPAGPPSAERREVGRYPTPAGPRGILVQRPPDGDGWRRVGFERRVSSADTLASLPGYRNEVRLDGGVHLLLWGNVLEQLPQPLAESRVVLHAPPEGLDADLTLQAGRVQLSNRKPQGPARVRLRFHKETWDLTLHDADTEVGADLFGRYSSDIAFRSGEEPLAYLVLVLLKGRAGVRVGYEDYPELRPAQGPVVFTWDNKGPGVVGPRALPQPLPEWGAVPPPPANDALKKFAQEMELALRELRDQMTDVKTPVDVLLEEALRSDRGGKRILAVRCLGAIDAVGTLLDALADEKHEETRQEAIFTLQHWLGRRGEHFGLLEKELQAKKYTPTQTDIVLQLLHGFTDENLANPETYSALIHYLNHSQLAIRQLAIWRLRGRVPEGRSIPYDPSGGSERRKAAVEKWRKVIPEGTVPAAQPRDDKPMK